MNNVFAGLYCLTETKNMPKKLTNRQKCLSLFPTTLSRESQSILKLLKSRQLLSAIIEIPSTPEVTASLKQIILLRIFKPFYKEYRRVLFDDKSLVFFVNDLPQDGIINGYKTSCISKIFDITK